MFRQPEVVVIPNRSLHRTASKFVDLTTADPTEGVMADPPPFRRGHTIEGSKRPAQTAEPDNAMAQALKRAKDKKEAEDAARRAERDEAKRVRVQAAAARLTQQPPAPPPSAQSEQAMRVVESMDDAILDAEASLQPPTPPDTSWHQKPAPRPAAKRPVQQPQPEDSHRLPDYVPRVERPLPDDPRVRNGSLAPTPRVAERIATMQSEDPTPAPERPLSPSGRHPWHEQVLKNGNLLEILAGRTPDQLKGDDLEAYERVLREGSTDKILAGRKIPEMSEAERAAYYVANGRKAAATRRERYGNISPKMIKQRRDMQEAMEAGAAMAMPILPKTTSVQTMKARKGDPLWVHRMFLAAWRVGIGIAPLSVKAGLHSRWTLRDRVISSRKFPKDGPRPDIIKALSQALGQPVAYFIDPDYPVHEGYPEEEVAAAEPQAAPKTVDLGALAADMTVITREPPRYVVVDGVKYLPTYPVEDDVPLPAPPGRTIWGFATMKVGSSFGVPVDSKGPAALVKKIEKAAADFQAENAHAKKWQFQVGTLPGEVRCWRLS
jgi:hypothetical protein